MNASSKHWIQGWAGALLAVLICESVGIVASVATQPSADVWYPTLEKPFFTPPSWLFAPVWTVLYALMGLAAWLVVRQGWHRPAVRSALGLFAAQLLLNGAWSFVFFGARSIAGGFIVIVLLWLAIAVTMRYFFAVRRGAGWLLVPYLLWVTYAAALNGAIWMLN